MDNATGKRSAVTACTFSRDGKFIVGALQVSKIVSRI